MAISPWCAQACWHINRLKLHLIGAFLLTPESVALVLNQILEDDSMNSFPDELTNSLRHAVPHPTVRSEDGAIVLNPYTDEQLAAMPFDQRYDFNAISNNQRFYAITLFILQICAACETFLKTKMDWIIKKRPELLNSIQSDIRPSVNTIVDATALSELLAVLRDQAVSVTVKGKCWKDKLRRFCKFLGTTVPQDEITDNLDNLFSIRNQLMHTKEPSLLDLTFISYVLSIRPDSEWSVYHVALPRLLQFADDIKDSLYKIDQDVSKVHSGI